MTRKLTLAAAVAAIAAVCLVLPGVSSAAEPTLDLSAAIPTSSGSFGDAVFTSPNGNITCAGPNHLNASWTTNANKEATTGTLEITFTNCRTTTSNITCTTSGQSSGVITTESSVFHLVYIKGFTKTVGALVTPGSNGLIAKFSCSIFGNVEIKGNGFIAHVTAPQCGETSTSSTLAFDSSAPAVQRYQEIENSATKFHLTSNLNGGAFTEASEDAEVVSTLANGATGQLTCP